MLHRLVAIAVVATLATSCNDSTTARTAPPDTTAPQPAARQAASRHFRTIGTWLGVESDPSIVAGYPLRVRLAQPDDAASPLRVVVRVVNGWFIYSKPGSCTETSGDQELTCELSEDAPVDIAFKTSTRQRPAAVAELHYASSEGSGCEFFPIVRVGQQSASEATATSPTEPDADAAAPSQCQAVP